MVANNTFMADYERLAFKHISYGPKRKNQSRYVSLSGQSVPRKILIKNAAYVVTVNDQDGISVLPRQSIYIVDDEIKAVFPSSDDQINLGEPDLIYDAGARGGIVITPGFINAHSHPTMYLMRSAMLLDYGQHLDETIAKMPLWQKHISGERAVVSTLGDLTEQQKAGITTTLNHNAIYEEVDQAALLCGQRMINCVSAISNSRPNITLDAVRSYIEGPKPALSTPGIALHYLYKVNEQLLGEIQKMQAKYQVLLTMHFAESTGTSEQCVRKFGRRETKLLADHGLLNSYTLLSHVLHVTDPEIRDLVKARVGIVHLPTSNITHKSGVFDYSRFAGYGGSAYVALGTDSVISKSRLDLLTEAFQTRITHLPEYTVYYEDLFKMITVNAARVLHQPCLGRIAPGFKADLAFWKLKDRGFLPFDEDDPTTLVGNVISHGGRNIRDLMINGRFVVSNRMHNLVNESDLIEEIQVKHMEVRRLVNEEKLGASNI